MGNVVQNSVYPKVSLCSELDLYFRVSDSARIDLDKSLLFLCKTGKVKTDTYFNSISVGKWKRYTEVSDLSFNIRFKGKIKISWFLHRLYFSPRILEETFLENETLDTVSIPLDFWSRLEDGMLAFEIEALEESEIYNFLYSTESQPRNNISLGIVITHFNRHQYVLPALERLKEDLLGDISFKDKVTLNVVDNSQNLPEVKNVNIIANENIGGSGGFSRGLISLKEGGNSTHCLFMDDDASCEVEGIKRTITLLEYAKDPDLSVCGAMLREVEMYRQFECGARFDGLCRPNKCGIDLRSVENLLLNENEEIIDYAGWWFFAFPLSKVKYYAFPYFVRGDDIGFGLAHNFNIVTLNGISSWQDDFSLKNGPLPYYLDTRNHIMQHFHGLVSGGLKGIIKTTARMVLKNLATYHYETALASIYAIEDTLRGNDFWRNNVDMSEKRTEILGLIKNEKVTDIPFSISSTAIIAAPNENTFARLLRWATLNGHLIPKLFFKKGIVAQHKGFGGSLRETYRYRKILYIHYPTNKGFVLEHDKTKFFRYGFRYIKAIFKLIKNYNVLKEEYQSSYNEFTSSEFWKKYFKLRSSI